MSEHVGENGLYAGSFNPPHLGHMNTMRQALEVFDTLHLLVQYEPGVDLVDWDTKSAWFEEINRELGGRLVVHKEMNEQAKGKAYTLDFFFEFLRTIEQRIGEPLAGFVFGNDYTRLAPEFERELPGKVFLFVDRPVRDGEEMSSTAIRNDLEGHASWLPPYVYESLRARKE